MRTFETGAPAHRPHVHHRAEKGWSGFKNGKLFTLVELEFDLLLTADRNLEYPQNLRGRSIAILLLSTNHWPTLKKQVPLGQGALNEIGAGECLRVEIPKR